MTHSIFMMISSILPVALVGLFAERNALLAQAQPGGGPKMGEPAGVPPTGEPPAGPEAGPSPIGQGQRPGGAAAVQGLEAFALPGGAITETEIPAVLAGIEQALGKISEAATSSGSGIDYPAIRSSLLAFQGWLKGQGCVAEVSSTYDIENTDGYDGNIFITHPGQIPFDIVFRMAGGGEQPYRLLLFVTTYELFNFGSFVKNTAKEDVFIPERWPEDAPGYWESRS